jgi:phosphomannomutase
MTTGTEKTEERMERRDITQRKYKRNPESIPYYEFKLIHRRINRNYRNKEQIDEVGDVLNSIGHDFMQQSDEDAQCNVLTEDEQALVKMNNSHRTPNKEDAKQTAQPENEDRPLSPEPDRRRLSKKEHEADHMKKRFDNLTKNTQKQLR